MMNNLASNQKIATMAQSALSPGSVEQVKGADRSPVTNDREAAQKMLNPWLAYYKPLPTTRMRLFCFHHAGGGASAFRSWAALLQPYQIELCPIQLPGRESRIAEKPYTSLTLLVTKLQKVLQPYVDQPFAFFGHSMGAYIAFQLAQLFQKRGQPPHRLIVAGATPPQQIRRQAPIYQLPDTQFLQRVAQLDGLPAEILENREMMALLLPILRADFTLCERTPRASVSTVPTILHCPISVYTGLRDPHVSEAGMAQWPQHTLGQVKLRKFPGNHFFLYQQPALVTKAIAQDLLGARC